MKTFFINTGGYSVNAIEGYLTSAVEWNDGSSVISFWVEKPTAENSYHFAGIIPGGLATDRGLLFSVGDSNPVPVVKITRALLNDSTGTELSPGLISVTAKTLENRLDTVPPESFVPVISRDQNIFNGQRFVSFSTQDKLSGIDHYEVRQGESEWQIAESPYLLPDQNARFLEVRAIDRAGNIRTEKLSPKFIDNPLLLASSFAILLAMILALWFKKRSKLLITLFVLFFLAAPGFSQAARLGLVAPQTSFHTGDVFNVKVVVDSPGKSLNAVSGTVNFPSEKLQIVSVSKADSIVSLWATEPIFSNSAGTVNFEGVILNPGFSGSGGQILTVRFKALGQGTVPLLFAHGSVLANDGQGTEILDGYNKLAISITQPAPKPEPVPPPEMATSVTPIDTTTVSVPETIKATSSAPLVVMEGGSRLEILFKILAYYAVQPTVLAGIIVILLVIILVLLAAAKERHELITQLEQELSQKRKRTPRR